MLRRHRHTSRAEDLRAFPDESRSLGVCTVYLYRMKGYYTVKLLGDGFSTTERIALEARYVVGLEAVLGGSEAATAVLLEAAGSLALRSQVEEACKSAERHVWPSGAPGGARFHVSAWSAVDL